MNPEIDQLMDDAWRHQQEQERDHARLVAEAEDALRRAIDLGLSDADVLAIKRIWP